ncbi:hypothetical protein [Methylomonas sp. MgM2]
MHCSHARADINQEELFSYRTLEARIPKKHPLRQPRKVVGLLPATLRSTPDAATHASPNDPDARLYKKSEGDKAQLAFLGHALMENRNGLVVDVEVIHATGTAKREAAHAMLKRTIRKPGATLGADKNDDTPDFVAKLRRRKVTPLLRARIKARPLTAAQPDTTVTVKASKPASAPKRSSVGPRPSARYARPNSAV